MRRVTRNAVIALLAVLVLLLALGALPGLLKSGDPYYLTAERVEVGGPDGPATANDTVDVTNLSAERYPYTTEALRNGTSDPYWRGPVGLKEAFSHSPFDEVSALRGRNPAAAAGEGVYVRDNGTLYRVGIGRQP